MKIVLIVFLVFVCLLVIPRLMMSFKASRMKGKDVPLTHKASRKRIQSGKKTVLYFHTPSCGACKMQGPIIDKIKQRHENAVFKIDASRDREIAISYRVMGVPFVVFVENCKIVKAAPGFQRESAIEGFFEEKGGDEILNR